MVYRGDRMPEIEKSLITKEVNVLSPVTKMWEEEIAIKDFTGKDISQKQTFFEVTVSGLKEDRDGEIMDEKALTDMLMQFKSGTIPFFPDHGKDPATGERTYSWKQIMGVWVDGRLEGDKLKAVAKLNSAHPDADLFKNYMQNGVPLGFSIGGKPIWVEEEII